MENFRLKVFHVTAEQLNFRKASEILNLSQPAVSQHIHALEQESKVRLFDRAGNRIALTPAGQVLLRYAKEIAKTIEQAEQALSLLQGEVSGTLRLGASTTIAQYLLPRILGAFLKEHPGVQLSVVSGNTETIVQGLAENKFELGIIEGPALRRDIKVEKFVEDTMVLIVNADHPWAGVAEIKPQALQTVPILLRERGSGSRRVVEQALKLHGLPARSLQIAMELDSTEAIVSGVEAGLGVGFVSQWAIGKELKLGTVVPVPIEGMTIHRDFSFIRTAGPEPTGPAGAFLTFSLHTRSALKPSA